MGCGWWRIIYPARRVRDPLSFGCGLLVIGRCLQMLFSLWYGVHAMTLCRVHMVCVCGVVLEDSVCVVCGLVCLVLW